MDGADATGLPRPRRHLWMGVAFHRCQGWLRSIAVATCQTAGMGKNNKQRRATKKRRKQRSGRPVAARSVDGSHRPDVPATASSPGSASTSSDQRSSRAPGGPRGGASYRQPTAAPSPAQLIDAAVVAWRLDPAGFEAALAAVVGRSELTRPMVAQRLEAAIEQRWGDGWTPVDIVHVAGRELTARHAEVAAELVIADGHRRRQRGQRMHPAWLDQLDRLDPVAGEGRRPPLHDLRFGQEVELLCLLVRMPTVTETLPPPGASWQETAGTATHLDARILTRVRALLAKAESTTFEDEAEALTAKAQELIARHAIDEALLHTVDDVGAPSARRILIDDPYADAKANLLHEIAAANRCRVVHSAQLGWVVAFGYDHDLDAVELLAASLLAQATGAMVRHGSRRDTAGRSRTRSFRRSFLLGFAQRVGERLRETTAAQMAADDRSARFVPVLAARSDQVTAATEAAFPALVERTLSMSNPTGFVAGRTAAELADLAPSARHLPGR